MTMQLSKVFAQIANKEVKLKTLVKDAIDSAKTMKQKVQIAAVASLWHIEKHGNWNVANHVCSDLVVKLGENGVRANALIDWYVAFGGMEWDSTKKSFVGFKGAQFIRDNFQKAQSVNWDSMRPEPEYTGFDLNNEIEKLLDKAMAQSVQRTKWMDGDSEKSKAKAEKIHVDMAKIDLLREALKATSDNTVTKAEPKALEVKAAENTDTKALVGHYQPVMPDTFNEERLATDEDGKLYDKYAPKAA